MGKTIWRSEPVWVENRLDELRIGVKGQSNSVIARTPRNVFRNSLAVELSRGRATNWVRGSQILPNPDKLRMLINIRWSEAMGAKVHGREGKNPDHQLRSPNYH